MNRKKTIITICGIVILATMLLSIVLVNAVMWNRKTEDAVIYEQKIERFLGKNFLINDDVGIFEFKDETNNNYIAVKLKGANDNEIHLMLFSFSVSTFKSKIQANVYCGYNFSYSINSETEERTKIRESKICLENMDIGIVLDDGENFENSKIQFLYGMMPSRREMRNLGHFYEPNLSIDEAKKKYSESTEKYGENKFYWDKATEEDLGVYTSLMRNKKTGIKFENRFSFCSLSLDAVIDVNELPQGTFYLSFKVYNNDIIYDKINIVKKL